MIRIDAIFYLYNFLIFFSILIFSNKNYRYYFYILFTILLFLLISQVHLNFNEHYVGGIYSHFFRIDILKNPISLLIAIIALFFILERIFFLLPNKLIEKVFDNLNLIIIFFIFLSFLNLLLLMKGISFQKNILVTTERGFQFINYSKLVSIFYYLNLVLFPVILFKSKDIFIRSLFIIFLFWFIWHTLIEPSRGYDFYYSRYLFPNIFLIFQLLFLININIIFKSRLLKTTFIICFLLYSIYSIKQITNTEYKNAYIELKKVNLKYSNDKTIFAIYNSNTNQWRGSYFHNRVKLPLKFFFNNYVISFNDDNFSF